MVIFILQDFLIKYKGKHYMDDTTKTDKMLTRILQALTVLSVLLLVLASSGCSEPTEDPSTQQTRTALSQQQTEVAKKLAEGGSLSNQERQATRAVLAEIGNQDTGVNVKPKPTEAETQEPEPELEPSPTNTTETISITDTPEPPSGPDFETWSKSANILLYEDMISDTSVPRYVKGALDSMGLPYKDDGSAQGWLKEDLLRGPPGGGVWDLVIVAAEAKTSVQGEFFEYVNSALDQGASVILEAWYLDQTFNGTASVLLDRCGVEYQNNWIKVPPQAQVMWPTGSDHPILRVPNALSFTKVTNHWWDESGEKVYDIGDRIQLAPGSDAELLVGTHQGLKNTHGTVAVCIDERLILQTFSSHQLQLEPMLQVWENYILHALGKRFENLE